jgi:hypothetical protein
MDCTVSLRPVLRLTVAQRNIASAIQFTNQRSLPEPTIGTTGLKSTAMITNPTAQENFPVRMAFLMIRRPDAQIKLNNSGCSAVIWSLRAAKSNIVMETQPIIVVSI